MYLNVIFRLNRRLLLRLIATYDVFEYEVLSGLWRYVFRLIATYDVFEFSMNCQNPQKTRD